MSLRISAFIERLGAAHGPALEALRAELTEAQSQSRQEVEGDMASLRNWMKEVQVHVDALEVSNTMSFEAATALATLADVRARVDELEAARGTALQDSSRFGSRLEALERHQEHPRLGHADSKRTWQGVSRHAKHGSGPRSHLKVGSWAWSWTITRRPWRPGS